VCSASFATEALACAKDRVGVNFHRSKDLNAGVGMPDEYSGKARRFVRRTQIITLLWLLVIAGGALAARVFIYPAHGQIAVRNQGFVPYADEPINYRSNNLSDPIAKLQKRIDSGQVTLNYEPTHSYLKSILEQLNIPISSQTLVFSKTSFQYKKISPQTPRALYFNDDVYVGWVHDGKELEVISFDPMQGAIYYLLDAEKADHPAFKRAELDCTQCHIAAGTHNVPGVLLRSIYPKPTGTQAPKSTSFITGQESPLKDRWGGWYVTGTSGQQLHMGNEVVQDPEHPEVLNRAAGANVLDLSSRFDTSAYLSGSSDIVAHLVLAHQTQMHNLITLTNYQARIALHSETAKSKPISALPDEVRQQYQRPADELVRYMLFTNEAPLDEPIKGNAGFAEQFAALGPRDARGRSLRDFDLHKRIFKYPCSYLIYSESFDSLPEPAKSYVYHRIFEVLTGQEQGTEFATLSSADRRAILEILLATKPSLPDEWRQYAKQAHLETLLPGHKRRG